MKKTGLTILSVCFAFSGGVEAWRQGYKLGAPVHAALNPEDLIEDQLEDQLEDAVEDDVEDAIEDAVEDALEDAIEDSVEDAVEDAVEDDIEDSIEGDVEDDIESEIEDAVESEIEGDIEDDVEDGLEDDLEDDIEDDVEDDVEDELEDDIEDDVEDEVDDDLEDEDDMDDADDDDENEDDYNEDGDSDDQNEADADLFTIGLDSEEQEIRAGETLILVRPEVASILDNRGYQSIEIQELNGLNYVLARVQIPDGFDLSAEAAAIASADPQGEVDFNHIYRPQQDPASTYTIASAPGVAYARRASFPGTAERERNVRVGLIDTHVDVNHRSLRDQSISLADFAEGKGARPDDHGTSVASILVGGGEDYAGLIPGAKLYAASVFHLHDTGGTIASAASLVRALDWLVLNKVPVVNMSLAGPPNEVLQAAIEAAAEKGVIVVAAAGNKGPVAKPLYPAAYGSVIAVTAVNKSNSVYRLAGRGDHIDFAAPGVEIVTASVRGGYAPETGTSMAAPFATAAVALHCAGGNDCANRDAVMGALIQDAEDLGPKGYDTTYGHGLIRP